MVWLGMPLCVSLEMPSDILNHEEAYSNLKKKYPGHNHFHTHERHELYIMEWHSFAHSTLRNSLNADALTAPLLYNCEDVLSCSILWAKHASDVLHGELSKDCIYSCQMALSERNFTKPTPLCSTYSHHQSSLKWHICACDLHIVYSLLSWASGGGATNSPPHVLYIGSHIAAIVLTWH